MTWNNISEGTFNFFRKRRKMIKEKELKKLEVKDVKLKDYYRMEDIVKLDEDEIPLIGITMDKMFKAIFIPNEKLLKRFILSQLPLELEEDEVKLQILNSELPVSNIKEYKKVVDVIVSIAASLPTTASSLTSAALTEETIISKRNIDIINTMFLLSNSFINLFSKQLRCEKITYVNSIICY